MRFSRGPREHYPMPWNGYLSRLGRQQWSASQWVGVLIFLAALSIGALGIAVEQWPSGPKPWWRKAASAYGWYLAIIIGMCVVIFVVNKILRRRHQRH
jgi:membrane protein YdbS with pleckstrin-like domain